MAPPSGSARGAQRVEGLGPRAKLALLLAALAALAAACHDRHTNEPNDALDPASWAAKARAQMPPDAFEVGVLILNGAPDADAAFLAAEQVTAAGGVGGRAVHVVYFDDLDVPPGAYDAKVEGLVEAGVQAILTSTSSDTIASYGIAAPAGVLSIASGSTSTEITSLSRTADLLFRTCPSDAIQGTLLARLAFDELTAAAPGATPTAAILFESDDVAYSVSLSATVAATFESLGGRITRSVPFVDDSGTTGASIRAGVQAAFAPGPDAPARVFLICEANPDPASDIIAEWFAEGAPRLGGSGSPFVFPDALVIPLLLDNVPGSALAALDGTPGISLAPGIGDGFARFAADYQARFGFAPDPFVANAYDAVALVALAAERAIAVSRVADPTGADIAASLRAVANGPGAAAGPGVAGLASALATIASGGAVKYAGAYSDFDLDRNGDIDGEVAYTVFRLDAAAASYDAVTTTAVTVVGP